MTFPTRSRIAPILLVAILAIGIAFLPATAFADDSSTSSTSTSLPDFVPSTTVLPLLGSNITIELTTDADGIVSTVTIDGELADHELEVDDGEIEIEFLLTNADGTFEVEVEFENGSLEVEVDTDGPAAPGDYVWAGLSCDGIAFSIAYTVNEDGSLTIGEVTGDVEEIDTEGDEIEVRLADGTEIEFEADADEFEITQKCHQDDDASDDDADDDDDDDDDDESDDDSDDDDHHDGGHDDEDGEDDE